ncbi:uracil-DNA glycosylase family protein [Fusobacterium ulcerans]|uniref:uracil-DNA glycosylase family protein n=1 Tax=Fusobacterium ulcerans TaxID=861 RepID=UPI0030AFC55C
MNKIINVENEELMKIFEEIQCCENIKKYYNGETTNCDEIIKSQREKEEDFQLPEPWNGDIVNAPILIISSNPSFNEKELYPTIKWKEEDRKDFYFNRFQSRWTKEEKYIKLRDGKYDKNWVRFWSSVKSRAKEIWTKGNISLGKDIALIEVVRCKSKEEKGVEKAISNCSRKFLDKTFSLSNSKVIICTGKRAETMIKEFYNLENKPYLENIIIGKRKRDLLFIPHPNARGQKKLSFLFLDSEIEKIKSKLK